MVLDSNLRVAESVRTSSLQGLASRRGVSKTKSRLLVVPATGLLIVMAITLLVLLAFESGAESRGIRRASPGNAEVTGAPGQSGLGTNRASDPPATRAPSYTNREGVWVKPGQERHVPLGRISIPAIDIDAPYRLGAHDDIIQLGPGLWPATPFPGERGNAVLAGHRTAGRARLRSGLRL